MLGAAVGLAVLACVSARPYAGSWNDGSRLATVEALVDFGTFAIDRSVYVDPAARSDGAALPYRESLLLRAGTQDKLLIGGRFYSDKSPVPAVLMAGTYWAAQRVTGLQARQRPDAFSYLMTVLFAGAPFVLGTLAMFRLLGDLLDDRRAALLLAGSFAFGTLAFTYTRHVNNHVLLLGVVACLLLQLHRWMTGSARDGRLPAAAIGPDAGGPGGDRHPSGGPARLLGIGGLAGFAYAIDLGAGPVIVLCTTLLIAGQSRRWRSVGLLWLGALPFLLAHHLIVFEIAGTLGPPNRVAEYLLWPGSPFTAASMTGTWSHDDPLAFLSYAGQLLAGKKGFLLHNPTLLLCAAFLLSRSDWRHLRFTPDRQLAAVAGAIAVGTWLVYAAGSTNYSGVCASIRWFVPLLAPGYVLIALRLRGRPAEWRSFLALAFWGCVLAWLTWLQGPWMARMVPFYWAFVTAAGLSGVLCRCWRSADVRPVHAAGATRALPAIHL